MKLHVEVIGSALQGQKFLLRPEGKEATWVVSALFDAAALKQRAIAGGLPCQIEVDMPDALVASLGWAPPVVPAVPAAVPTAPPVVGVPKLGNEIKAPPLPVPTPVPTPTPVPEKRPVTKTTVAAAPSRKRTR